MFGRLLRSLARVFCCGLQFHARTSTKTRPVLKRRVMSLVDTTSPSPIDYGHRLSSSKRKLDDYSPSSDDDDFSDLVSVRMRKDEINAVHHSSSNVTNHQPQQQQQQQQQQQSLVQPRASDAKSSASASSSSSSASCSNSTRGEWRRSASSVQFFVRMFSAPNKLRLSNCNSLVIQANSSDTVRSLHEKIQSITGIPVIEQRLIYRGKQLQWEKSLAECSIQNDAGLQLVGRMRSTEFPMAWQAIDSMVSSVCRLCRDEPPGRDIKKQLSDFFGKIPKTDSESAASHFDIFLSSSVPAALVMLYMSPHSGNKELAETMIKCFLTPDSNISSKSVHTQAAPIVLEFCKLLGRIAHEDTLYHLCRSTLGSLVETIGFAYESRSSENFKQLIDLKEIFPFVSELASSLFNQLSPSKDSPMSGRTLQSDVCDFTAFLHPLRSAFMEQVKFRGPISLPIQKGGYNHRGYGEEIESLHVIYIDLLRRMDECLQRMEGNLASKGAGEGENVQPGLPEYLAILKELNGVSKLYLGAEEQFWTFMKLRRVSVCDLIINHAKRTEDNLWLLEHKDVTNFECRRHLTMLMFPEGKEDYEDLHEMLIDRSQILAESFEYIAHAEPKSLQSGLFMEFKNEEATGPGVLREWFFLVCQAIFNPQNALFVACPNDRRRFYPNPASKVDPLHLEYFSFSGRVMALALMHKVQVGIVFDRVFFLQLAGMCVSLEDIQDADPLLYNSCKQVLEMDGEFIDSDALGLTFVREIEELGSRRVVELCPGGKNMVVNSRNRGDYVNLLIQHRFVISISEQVSHFAQGFADILSDSSLPQKLPSKLFFKGLELGDLDCMLHGSESAICVEDWKIHTDYHGYKETDPQISWFWKIVGEMSPEQRKVLLFFWTSVKYLPVEGFCGLASRLYIYRTTESHDRLPSSHTCFFRLCFPPYPSMAVMQDRLNIITQEHVGCSFGTW